MTLVGFVCAALLMKQQQNRRDEEAGVQGQVIQWDPVNYVSFPTTGLCVIRDKSHSASFQNNELKLRLLPILANTSHEQKHLKLMNMYITI